MPSLDDWHHDLIFNTQWDDDAKDPTTRISDYRMQNMLENRSNLVAQGGIASLASNVGKIGATAFSWIVSIPLYGVFNGVMDWDLNIKPLSFFYRSQLDRAYGYSAVDLSSDVFLNDRAWLGLEHDVPWLPLVRMVARSRSFRDLQGSVEDGRVPLWIVNARGGFGQWTTLWYRRKAAEDIARLEASPGTALYEFTPYDHGSDAFGHYPYGQRNLIGRKALEPLTISEAVNASGAAVDGVAVGLFARGAMSLLNLDLGRHAANYGRPAWRNYVHRALPFPLYWIDDQIDPRNPTTVYLSDGGHIENLGAYTLVRRGLPRMIFVDGEHDPTSKFEGLRKLRDHLKRDLGLELVIDHESFEKSFDVFDPPFAYARGCIYGVEDDDGPVEVRFLYFKLSMDVQQPAQRNCDLEDTIEDGSCNNLPDYHPHVTRRRDASVDFPQVSTVDISFTRRQFLAYRRLGVDLVRHAKDRRAFDWLDGRGDASGSNLCPALDAANPTYEMFAPDS